MLFEEVNQLSVEVLAKLISDLRFLLLQSDRQEALLPLLPGIVR